MSIEKPVASLDPHDLAAPARHPSRGKRFPKWSRTAPGGPAAGQHGQPTPRTARVRVADLSPGGSPRLAGESAEHIRVLAESGDRLPPILVHRPTMSVVDGAHRVHAVRLRGEETIEAQFLDGTEEEAFLDAVRANMAHGLPLSMADREAAAARVIDSYPQWSDKAVAEVVGLAPGTVAGIRRRSDVGTSVTIRVGRDGRARPVDWARGRIAAARIIGRRPKASLREVAREAGVSPATVRDVRARLERGEDPVPAGWRFADRHSPAAAAEGEVLPTAGSSAAAAASQAASKGEPAGGTPDVPVAASQPGDPQPADAPPAGSTDLPDIDPRAVMELLRADPTLRYSESGRAAWRWLYSHAVGLADWSRVVEAIPPHCAYQLSSVARRCAEDWLALADRLDRKAEAPG